MPKAKPDRVEVIRIELQESERRILESALATWQFSKAATAFDQIMSLENMYLLVTLIEIMTDKEILPGTPNDIYQLIDWIRDYRANNDSFSETAVAAATAFGDSPFWAFNPLNPSWVFNVGDIVT